ncbi:MAG: prolipoprotein diacylglyceryl transferase family protein [Planctomycetota bacterium]
MYPVLFGFLPSFGVLVATGFLVGVALWGKLLQRYGLEPDKDPDRSSDTAVWLLIGVIAGARLLYVAVEIARYLTTKATPSVGHDFVQDPLKILFVWEGGLVMFGGFAGAVLLGFWKARKYGLHPWNALDTGLVGGFVGQAIGRWGCLLVGDDYGSVVDEKYADLPFPITLRVPSAEWLAENPKSLFEHDLAGQVLWATQPWMSVNALIVALLGWLVLRRRRYFGQVAGVIFIYYSVSRAVIEAFRGDELRGVWGGFSTSQILAVVGVAVGVAVLATAKKRPVPESLAP